MTCLLLLSAVPTSWSTNAVALRTRRDATPGTGCCVVQRREQMGGLRPAQTLMGAGPSRRKRVQMQKPGNWSAARQAAYNAAVSSRARASGGHGGDGEPTAPHTSTEADSAADEFATMAASDDRRRAWHASSKRRERVRYACELCSLSFDRAKQLEEHAMGRRHRETVAAASVHWADFKRGSWWEPTLTATEHEEIVTRAWSLDAFLAGLPSRSRSDSSGIAPHVTLASLAPRKRLQLWRFLRELIPSQPLLPEVFTALETAGHGRFCRVKEILESGLTFGHAEQLILRSDPRTVVKRGKVQQRPGRAFEPRLGRVVDVACGHGLVGLLLAYRFPGLSVLGVDRQQRAAYAAYVECWKVVHQTHHRDAEARAGDGDGGVATLANIQFIEGELSDLVGWHSDGAEGGREPDEEGGMAEEGGMDDEGGMVEHGGMVDGQTLVLCVHGCNEVNVEALELARAAKVRELALCPLLTAHSK